MSINNLESVTQASDKFYDAEKTDVSFFDDNPPINSMSQEYHGILPYKTDYALRPDYFIPLESVKSGILQTYSFITEVKSDLELLLSNVYIKSSLNPNLEESHKKLWEELKRYNQVKDQQQIMYLLANIYTLKDHFQLAAEDYLKNIIELFLKLRFRISMI